MTLAFSDTFTEASDTDLHLHTPDTGTSWSVVWQTTSTDKWVINSTQDRIFQSGAANSGAIYTADATYDSADYSVEVTFAVIGAAGTASTYLIARLTDQENMIAFRHKGVAGSSTNTGIYEKVAGTWSLIGANFAGPAAGDVVKLEVIGTTAKVYFNGVEQASRTITLTSTGKGGLGLGGGAELVSSGDDPSTGVLLDVFSVNTVSSGTDLVIQDATHAHTSDNLALTQVHELAVQDALHAHTADNLALSMQAVVRDKARSANAASTNIVVSKPAGLQAGDGMLAEISFVSSGEMVTVPTDWEFVRGFATMGPALGGGGNRTTEIYKKILTQAEADNPTQTWTWVKSNTSNGSGGIIGFVGTSLDIVDEDAISVFFAQATTSVVCNGIRARYTNELGVGFFITTAASSSFTPDANMTAQLDVGNTSMTIEYATEVFSGTNFIPDRTATGVPSGNVAGIMVGVKSAGSVAIPAPTTATVVQEAEAAQDSGGTLSVTFAAKPKDENQVVFAVYPGADAAVSYTPDPAKIHTATGDGTDVIVYVQSVLPDTSQLTYDFTITPSTAPSAVKAYEVDGLWPGVPWDRIGMSDSDSGAGTVTSQGSGTGGTTHEAKNWILSVTAINHNAPGTVGWTNGTNPDQVSAPTAAVTLATAYREVSSAGAYSDTASWTNAAKANTVLVPFRIGANPVVDSFADDFNRSNEALENSGNWGVIEGGANVATNRVDSVAPGADDDNMLIVAKRLSSNDISVSYDEHTGSGTRASLGLICDLPGTFGPSDTPSEWGRLTGNSARWSFSINGFRLGRHYRNGLMVDPASLVEAEPALPYKTTLKRIVRNGFIDVELYSNDVLKVSYTDKSFMRVNGCRYVGIEAKGIHTVDNFSAEIITGATDLEIQSATHAHSADNLSLIQTHELAIQDASHGHTAESVALVMNLAIQDALHAHTAENLVLGQSHILAIADALHAHTADNVVLAAWAAVNRRSLTAVSRRGA